MKFVPVRITGGATSGQKVLFCVWETRCQDYQVFVTETGRTWTKPNFEQSPADPAVMVSWDDAHAFCAWLTEREHKSGKLGAGDRYRLPSDHEWSCAVGIGAQEDPGKSPNDKTEKLPDAFPWGSGWPPPAGAGNYGGEEISAEAAAKKLPGSISGFKDAFTRTAPVGSFAPNTLGLFDLGGNVWEWCEDWFSSEQKERVTRGASWINSQPAHLSSSKRQQNSQERRSYNVGFRAVLSPAFPAEASAASSTVSAADVVKANRSNLVFVTTPDGAGSGFIAHFGTGTFLITNAHVAAGARGAMFKTLDGNQVQAGAPAVAVGHDIFLMALKPADKALEVMTGVDQNASIGDAVVVLGNAEGAGVINTIQGKIVGVGPNLVEVDAPFQPGNSGSPIVHLKSGKVIGVATYLTIRKYDSATKEAVKQPIVRRFGYRLDSIKSWQPVNWQAFYAQATEMEAVEKLTDDLANFLRALGKDGKVSRGANSNPAIKNRIDQWVEAKSKRLSPRDSAAADQSLLSFLKVTCQSDITAAQEHLTYDYFQRGLADQQRERKEISDVFSKIIEELRK